MEYLEERRERTTNSTQIWRRHRVSNLGYFDGNALTTVPPSPPSPALQEGQLEIYRYLIRINKIPFQSFAIFVKFLAVCLECPSNVLSLQESWTLDDSTQCQAAPLWGFTISNFMIFYPQAGKVKRIPCSDWLPKWAR